MYTIYFVGILSKHYNHETRVTVGKNRDQFNYATGEKVPGKYWVDFRLYEGDKPTSRGARLDIEEFENIFQHMRDKAEWGYINGTRSVSLKFYSGDVVDALGYKWQINVENQHERGVYRRSIILTDTAQRKLEELYTQIQSCYQK